MRYVAIWLSVAVAIGLALWLRLGWIENTSAAHHCLAGAQSLGCDARGLGVLAFTSGAVTVVAMATAALALLWKHPLSAWLAALGGGIALMLYSPEAGAAALLIGVLRLARLHGDAWSQPRRQHRRSQQHVAQRP